MVFAVRDVAREDVTFAAGLPITKAERTILDLALLGEDPSLVRDALYDARRLGLDEERLRDLAGNCGGAPTVVRVIETIFGSGAWSRSSSPWTAPAPPAASSTAADFQSATQTYGKAFVRK
jgi:hypothetical protein